jgi:hypothetical protein
MAILGNSIWVSCHSVLCWNIDNLKNYLPNKILLTRRHTKVSYWLNLGKLFLQKLRPTSGSTEFTSRYSPDSMACNFLSVRVIEVDTTFYTNSAPAQVDTNISVMIPPHLYPVIWPILMYCTLADYRPSYLLD